MKNIVERLSALLKERKNADPSSSYVASLYAKGNEKIIEKIAEETDELIAEITEDLEKNKVIHEAADLWFHVMVLLTNNGIDPTEILKELESREGLSGIEEKKKERINGFWWNKYLAIANHSCNYCFDLRHQKN